MPSHMPSLDAIRGLAAFVVAVAHAGVFPFARTMPIAMAALGLSARIAVITFFVLSGHVIVGSALTMHRNGGFRPVVFAVHRFARIYPPFLLALMLAWAVAFMRDAGWIGPIAMLMTEPVNISPLIFIRDLVFLFGSGTPVQNINAPVWSLRIEVICYVLTGCVAVVLSGNWVARTVTGCLCLILVSVTLLRLDAADIGFVAFAAGGLVAVRPKQIGPWPARLAWAVLLGLGLLILTSIHRTGDQSWMTGWVSWLFQQAAIVAAALFILRLMAVPQSPGPLPIRPFALMAPFSYTLFITHSPILVLLARWVPENPSLFAGAAITLFQLAIVSVFAWQAARVVERHAEVRSWLIARLPVRWIGYRA